MSDIRIDDDGFLLGDAEQQRTEAESVLMKEIKADTTTIVSLLKGTVKLQRDALKAAQIAASPKPKGNHANANSGQSSRVNLAHSSRTASPSPNNVQAAPIPPTVRPNRQSVNQSPTQDSGSNSSSTDTARVNRQRGANGRFTGDGTSGEGAQANGDRDSRGRFTGGNGSSAVERSAASRITDGLKDLNNTLSVNANTDRIDPMVDAIKEAGSVITTGIDAGKKVLSVGNTLIAKPAMALGRGIKGLIKPNSDAINSPAAWYKRIWRTLVQGNRQDQTQHNQEQRRLDEIARGQGGHGGGGDSSILMMLGLAALLAAFKGFKWPELPKFEWPKLPFSDRADNESPLPAMRNPLRSPLTPTKVNLNHPVRAPQTQPSHISKAFDWAKETKIGKVTGGLVKKLPFIGAAIEGGVGGANAYNIDKNQSLTSEQKAKLQAENAGKTGGRIGGGLAGATAGGALALKATAATMNPYIIVPSVVSGSILGGIYGADAGGYLGEKAGSGIYKSIKNTPSKKSKNFIEPSVYADRDSDSRGLYDQNKALDVDGDGRVTRDEMIKGGRPDLLGDPDALIKSKGFTPEKAKSIKATSERLGINPNHLAQIISFETGGSFDPSQKNLAGGSARGLIQFMPSTAKGMGTTTETLAAMSFDEQMVYVEKYLTQRGIGKNGKTSLPDMYDAVLGSGYKKGSEAYRLNAGVDTNRNAIIEKGEAVKSKKFQHHARQYFAEVQTNTPKVMITPTAKVTTNTVPSLKAAPVSIVPLPNVQAIQSVQAKEQPTRLNNTPTPIKVSIAKPLVGQNVSDRGIAHILTGGIGEMV